jgi:pyridinium-3,5-bisthiocarboxylic acid mononucleotide nickel chelatase
MNLPAGYQTDTVTRLETNLDDLSPEITAAVMEKLFAAGALDVWLTTVQMKKNRPGVQLSVLCEEPLVERMAEILFTEASTFGLRLDRVVRLKLERRFETVRTEFGEVTVKIGFRDGRVLQVAPEFESCRATSEKSGQPLRAIYAAAMRAYAKL